MAVLIFVDGRSNLHPVYIQPSIFINCWIPIFLLCYCLMIQSQFLFMVEIPPVARYLDVYIYIYYIYIYIYIIFPYLSISFHPTGPPTAPATAPPSGHSAGARDQRFARSAFVSSVALPQWSSRPRNHWRPGCRPCCCLWEVLNGQLLAVWT